MGNVRKLTLALGTLVAVLTATELAAQNQNTAPETQSPMMGQDQGQGMMQTHMAEPRHKPA